MIIFLYEMSRWCWGVSGGVGGMFWALPLIWRRPSINHDVLISCKHERADRGSAQGVETTRTLSTLEWTLDNGRHCVAVEMDAERRGDIVDIGMDNG